MTYHDDHPDDMTPPSAADDLDDRRIEALVRGTVVSDEPRLAELLLLARSVGHGPAPQPSSALAALLSGGAASAQTKPTDLRWRRRLATIAIVSVGSSAAVVSAAAANVLPQHAQQVVARVVNDVSPLTLPGAHPVRHPKPRVKPATKPTTAATSPTTVARTPAVGTPATQPTPARTSGPGATTTPEPGHSPVQGAEPTQLPTQAAGPGDDHGRPTHAPTTTGGSHDDGSKAPKSARPTPKPGHGTDGGSGKSGSGKSSDGKANTGKGNQGNTGSGGKDKAGGKGGSKAGGGTKDSGKGSGGTDNGSSGHG
jgi:hypothetical protein